MRNKFVFFCLILLLPGCASNTEQVCVGKACFSADVVRKDTDRAKGLMFRKGLAQDKGMLFVFENEDIYPFWMKNMTFPIDIIWISKDKRVVHIETNVPPCQQAPCAVYTPSAKASYVLEVSAGDAVQKGIKSGDQVFF